MFRNDVRRPGLPARGGGRALDDPRRRGSTSASSRPGTGSSSSSPRRSGSGARVSNAAVSILAVVLPPASGRFPFGVVVPVAVGGTVFAFACGSSSVHVVNQIGHPLRWAALVVLLVLAAGWAWAASARRSCCRARSRSRPVRCSRSRSSRPSGRSIRAFPPSGRSRSGSCSRPACCSRRPARAGRAEIEHVLLGVLGGATAVALAGLIVLRRGSCSLRRGGDDRLATALPGARREPGHGVAPLRGHAADRASGSCSRRGHAGGGRSRRPRCCSSIGSIVASISRGALFAGALGHVVLVVAWGGRTRRTAVAVAAIVAALAVGAVSRPCPSPVPTLPRHPLGPCRPPSRRPGRRATWTSRPTTRSTPTSADRSRAAESRGSRARSSVRAGAASPGRARSSRPRAARSSATASAPSGSSSSIATTLRRRPGRELLHRSRAAARDRRRRAPARPRGHAGRHRLACARAAPGGASPRPASASSLAGLAIAVGPVVLLLRRQHRRRPRSGSPRSCSRRSRWESERAVPKPRLLVFNQYYWPGLEATAHLLSELCARALGRVRDHRAHRPARRAEGRPGPDGARRRRDRPRLLDGVRPQPPLPPRCQLRDLPARVLPRRPRGREAGRGALHDRPADHRRRRAARRAALRRAARRRQPGRLPRGRGRAEASREPRARRPDARADRLLPAPRRPGRRDRRDDAPPARAEGSPAGAHPRDPELGRHRRRSTRRRTRTTGRASTGSTASSW